MIETATEFQSKRLALHHGVGRISVLGFGTLIPGAEATITATSNALEAGFRHFDCAERYRNEVEVGKALRAALDTNKIPREDLFICKTLDLT